MSDLYVVEPGALVRSEGGRVFVGVRTRTLAEYPIETIEALFLLTGVGLTRGAVEAFAERRIPVLFVTRPGRLVAHLAYPLDRHLEGRLGQLRAFHDPELRLAFAHALAGQKRSSQRLALGSYRKRGELEAPPSWRDRVGAGDFDRLRGYEGAATVRYLRAWRTLVPPEWASDRRTRHPPADPLNALLSFGYTLASGAVAACVAREGLDPWLGMLHAPHHSMEALVQDLVEPFRAALVDPWVLRLVRAGVVRPEDFEGSEAGPYLADTKALRAVVRSYVDALARPTVGWTWRDAPTARDALRLWTRSVREAFAADDPNRLSAGV
ncbi:MAG: CRISPR-associated endonuclease Cas1 [Fimbriimonadaceae bacterium]|nr:CRISPR-associated endonuclease Cas1 [Fimbriimonadaceae bacterium]